MKSALHQLASFIVQYWNAILAGLGLAGVALFTLIPPLQQYVEVFVFLAANALVWTVIEIRAELRRDRARSSEEPYENMRAARSSIVSEIEGGLKSTSPSAPLPVVMVGGRLRSMSDIVRETADDLRSGRCRGHVSFQILCLDPEYLRERILPGGVEPAIQTSRNASYASTVESISAELRRLDGESGPGYTIHTTVVHYREDPHYYAYCIGNSSLFWGPYTFSPATSDFVGPENPCFQLEGSSTAFLALKKMITSRLELSQVRDAQEDEA